MVTCHPSILPGSAVSSKGVVMQISNSNAKLIVTLLGALNDKALGNYYTIVAKDMD